MKAKRPRRKVGKVDERQEQDNELTRDKLEALKMMKNDKVPGCDTLPIKLIKKGSNMMKGKILRIFNKACKEENIVQDWVKIIIQPI